MHFKLGLISGLVAAASASISPQTLFNGDLTELGKEYTSLYIQPNVDETCFSIKPVVSCDDDHVAAEFKHKRVGFHCLNTDLPIVRKMKAEIKTGKKWHLENKSQDIQAFVEVPTRCEKVKSGKNIVKKLYEKTPELKVHLIQPHDNEESFYSDYDLYPSTQVENWNDMENEKAARWLDWNVFDNLLNKHITMSSVLDMNNSELEKWMETLKFVVHKYGKMSFDYNKERQWAHHLDHFLPNSFSKVAKHFFETVMNDNFSKEQNEEIYEQYKELVRRIYAYTVKQVLQMKEYSYMPVQYEHQLPVIIRNLWYKIQRELTASQIQKLQKFMANYENQNVQIQDVLFTDAFDVTNRNYLKQIENQLTKILVAGLIVAKNHHPMSTDVLYETSSQYSKLLQYLNLDWNKMV